MVRPSPGESWEGILERWLDPERTRMLLTDRVSVAVAAVHNAEDGRRGWILSGAPLGSG